LLVFALLALGGPSRAGAQPSGAGDPAAQSSFLGQLAGTGGSVSFRTGRFPNGEPGWFHLGTDEAAGRQVFEARGRIELITPDLNLRCRHLSFLMDTGVLLAREEVDLKTSEIEATCQAFDYDRERGTLHMSGTPKVLQRAGTSTTSFDGMEVFALERTEAEEQVVRLTGPRPITILLSGAETAEGEEPSDEAEPASGLAKLGSNLRIEVSPRGETDPRVRSTIDPEGELSEFTAAGSILMVSEDFQIRCDEMTYVAAEQRFVASGDVYFKQQSVEADSGHLVYELDTGRVTLTVNPDIRRFEPGGVTHITEYDIFIIEPRADGQPDLRGVGDGRSYFTPIDSSSTRTSGTPERPVDTEIRIETPSQVP
jgi:lipopolysaccharide export system protein LptA